MTNLNELGDDASRNTRGRFEQWVKNPQCEANAISAVLNVRMDKIAESIGIRPEFGQSPFAIVRGLQFEGWLFKENAKVMREALVRVKALKTDSDGFLDLRLQMNGGKKIKSIDEAIKQSHALLNSLSLNPAEDFPTIVAGLALRIPKGVMLPEATLIIDILTIEKENDEFKLQVGEIKVFPDRGGHTDPTEISTARAQAGVYQHALEITVESLNLKNPPKVEKKGFLVFTWPVTNSPVVRTGEDLTYQALRASQGFDKLDFIAAELLANKLPGAKEADHQEWILHSKTEYKESCWSFCDLAARCQDLAIADDRPIILGREAARSLGSLSVERAIQLLDGEKPKTDFENSLQVQLQSVNWGILK